MDRTDERSEVSIVGRGTRIEGTVVAAGSLRLEGEVKGKITAEGDVSLSPQGRVEANIRTTTITLAGQVKGDLTAEGDLSLPADSRLDGNVRAHNVEVGGWSRATSRERERSGSAPALGWRATSPRRLSRSPKGQYSLGVPSWARTPQGGETTQGEETAQPAAQIPTAASTSRPSGS